MVLDPETGVVHFVGDGKGGEALPARRQNGVLRQGPVVFSVGKGLPEGESSGMYEPALH